MAMSTKPLVPRRNSSNVIELILGWPYRTAQVVRRTAFMRNPRRGHYELAAEQPHAGTGYCQAAPRAGDELFGRRATALPLVISRAVSPAPSQCSDSRDSRITLSRDA